MSLVNQSGQPKAKKQSEFRLWNLWPLVFIKRFLLKLIPIHILMQFVGSLLAFPSLPLRNIKIKNYVESYKMRKLQIACGDNLLEGWLNTDVFPGQKAVVFLNAKRHFPFRDCTFDYIFAEHFIEHLDYYQGNTFLCECLRVLKPGGKIRLTTPHLGFLMRIYNRQRNELEERYVKSVAMDLFPHAQADYEALAVNQCFCGYGHRFIYDFYTLEHSLVVAGFTNVKRYKVNKSDDANLSGIERHAPMEFNELEAMAIEAIRPYPIL